MFDQDGSVANLGYNTFIISRYDPAVLPPASLIATNCVIKPDYDAYACNNLCYRS